MTSDSFVYPLDPKVAHGVLATIAGIHPKLADVLAAIEATLVDPEKPVPPGYDAAVAERLILDARTLLTWSPDGSTVVREQRRQEWIAAAKAFFARPNATAAPRS